MTASTSMARKAGIASFIGTTIEWYDFFIFGTASALVFDKLFFPDISPAAGTLASFATFWVGFLARPLGGIVFGHLGDKIGRKKTLVITLLMMGIATAAIGCLPTYASIGIAAPAVLVACRLIQGFAVGGEWGGAVLIASEHAPKGRGIVYGAFAQQGSPAGQILSSLAFLGIGLLSDTAFDSWGWRLPFLASAALVVVGLIIRLRVTESPEMRAIQEKKQVAKLPIGEVLRTAPGLIALGVGASAIGATALHFKSTFALEWATSELGFAKSAFLTVTTISGIVQFIVQPFGALIGARWNPRTALKVFLTAELILFPIMFLMIGTGSLPLAIIGMSVATMPHALYYAMLAGVLAEAFPTRIRYTSISLSYQLCATIFAGTAPFVGQSLMELAGGQVWPVVAYSALLVSLSLYCTLALMRRGAAGRAAAGAETVPVSA